MQQHQEKLLVIYFNLEICVKNTNWTNTSTFSFFLDINSFRILHQHMLSHTLIWCFFLCYVKGVDKMNANRFIILF